jgi:hypothetical protein
MFNCLIDASSTEGWKKLDENKANHWIAATNTHLYKATKNGQVYQLNVRRADPSLNRAVTSLSNPR